MPQIPVYRCSRGFGILLGCALIGLSSLSGFCQGASDTRSDSNRETPSLRIAGVVPAAVQPQRADPAVVFFDAFDRSPEVPTRYSEFVSAGGSFVWSAGTGLSGGSMQCQFEKDQVDAGRLHVLLGRNPIGRGHRSDETFREVYWRVYVKHEAGWEGNPAKLARATCMAGRDYSQGMIAHVWGGRGEVLCIDPATGIREGRKVTTRYNDFANLKWLGARQGVTPVFGAAESGRWVCVESHIRLNTPGHSDGGFELWVDGKREASRNDLDWHGDWTEYGINAVFLENYCNTGGRGSVKRQARWFDEFVISTRPIGPMVAKVPVKLQRTNPALAVPWMVEVSTDAEGRDIVWRSHPAAGSAGTLTVEAERGEFTGSRLGERSLASGATHWLRIRGDGNGAWSPWHAPFGIR